MVKNKKSSNLILYVFKFIFKAIFRCIYIILAAAMIGFANAYYDENKWVQNLKNPDQKEQIFKSEEKK